MASACGIPEVKCQLLVHTNDPFRQNNVVADEALTSTNNLRPFLANFDRSSSQCNRPLPLPLPFRFVGCLPATTDRERVNASPRAGVIQTSREETAGCAVAVGIDYTAMGI